MQIPFFGIVEAGFPSPAEEELIDTITLDQWLIKNREATYMLKVKGDSMIEAGILEGDIALIDRSRQPMNGDIVIARLNDGWVMKYFRKQGNTIVLAPGNRNYRPIVPKEGDELEIAAVVTAIIRKYR